MKIFVMIAGALLTLIGLCLVFFTDWSLTGLMVAVVGFLVMLFAPQDKVAFVPVNAVPVRQVSSRLELPTELNEAFEQPAAQIPDSFFSTLSEHHRR
ncbi:hypothetical protein [Sphingomonas rubra]|uniref:hypothetical protein n=1 Tax=Sphingomonas rubra TaxID=634430 RepID=UPI0011608A82|nr:hypothetical protein [Sphingomonas rubra]